LKASQLIALLEKLRLVHGDLPVTAMIKHHGNGLGEIQAAEVVPAEPDNEWGFALDSFWLQ
jgi:hypothetical protein